MLIAQILFQSTYWKWIVREIIYYLFFQYFGDNTVVKWHFVQLEFKQLEQEFKQLNLNNQKKTLNNWQILIGWIFAKAQYDSNNILI